MGSFVSVALSLGLPPVAVSDCRILHCPDFPLDIQPSDRLADCYLALYHSFLLIQYPIHHPISQLIHFPRHMDKFYFLELSDQRLHSFIHRP